VVTVYFEDSIVNAGIFNLGVRKALWPLVQKTEVSHPGTCGFESTQ
jgi:hypothetical protein